MLRDLEMLLELQVIDYDLGELERSKEYLPDMMSNLTREMTDAEKKLEEARQKLTDSKVNQKNLEVDILAKETNLQKYQQQMMSIKTNKEYDALVAEIDSIKGSISTQETLLLETIETIDLLEKEMGELEEKATQITENNARQLKILQEKIDSIGEKVSGKQSSRKKIVTVLPRSTMSVYERVRRGKGAQSVVAVKNNACGACFKALTPKKIQEIRRADNIHTCDDCGCLIFWSDTEISKAK